MGNNSRDSFQLNHRRVSLSNLHALEGTTPFESDTISFLKAWLNGNASFSIQTSGSTGVPKTITHKRVQMEASATATIQALQLSSSHVALVCIPTRYVGGRMMLVRALLQEMPIIAMEPEGNPLARALQEDVPVGFCALVPLQMERFLDESFSVVDKLSSTQAVILGGAPVSPRLEQRLQEVPCPVYHTYGMTETVSHVALRSLNGPQRSEAFTLMPGIDAETDDRGCLRICGAVSNQEWVQTNDLIAWEGDRSFRWLGRADNVINTGGVKVFIETVERTIESLWPKKGQRFFLYGKADERLGQQVRLMVEGEPWRDSEQQGIISKLSDRLPPFHAPKSLTFVSAFVETPTGKINRKATVEIVESDP